MTKSRDNQPKQDDLVKQKIQKDADKEAFIKRCPQCGKQTFPEPRQCFGHGGGAGGGGGAGKAASVADMELKPSRKDAPGRVIDNATEALDAPHAYERKDVDFTPAPEPKPENEYEKLFDRDLISQLLADELLLIDNNADTGILSVELIKMLQLNPKLLSDPQLKELQKFMKALLDELDAFKKEKGITGREPEIVKDKELIVALKISLAKGFYDAFIQHLANRDLLPVLNINQNPGEKVKYPKESNLFNPNPLAMKPTPQSQKAKEEEKSYKTIKPKSILDGFKPH